MRFILLLVLAVGARNEAAAATVLVIQLVDGDQLTGELVLRSEEEIVISHRILGRLSIPVTEIESEAAQARVDTEVDVEESPTAQAAPGTTETAPKETVTQAQKWFSDWDRRVAAGVSGARGNGNSQDANVALRLARDDEHGRTLLESAFFFARANGETRKSDLFAAFTQDWLIPESRWFSFARGRYEFDQFEAWDHRVSATGGMGYDFIDTSAVELRLRGGLGFRRTIGGQDRLTPEGLIGMEGLWRISADQVLKADSSWIPDFGEPGEYRLLSSASWSTRLSRSGKLNLEFGLANEYDSDPEDSDVSNNDFDYYGRIGYDF